MSGITDLALELYPRIFTEFGYTKISLILVTLLCAQELYKNGEIVSMVKIGLPKIKDFLAQYDEKIGKINIIELSELDKIIQLIKTNKKINIKNFLPEERRFCFC